MPLSTHNNILNFSNKPSNDISRKNGDDVVSEVDHAKCKYTIEDLTRVVISYKFIKRAFGEFNKYNMK